MDTSIKNELTHYQRKINANVQWMIAIYRPLLIEAHGSRLERQYEDYKEEQRPLETAKRYERKQQAASKICTS